MWYLQGIDLDREYAYLYMIQIAADLELASSEKGYRL